MFRQKISLGVGKSVISGASLSSSWPDIANSNRSTRKRRKVSGKLLVKSSWNGNGVGSPGSITNNSSYTSWSSLCNIIVNNGAHWLCTKLNVSISTDNREINTFRILVSSLSLV